MWPKIKTTSGSGYIPQIDPSLLRRQLENYYYNYAVGNLPIDTIRQRLYNNLTPVGYNNPIERIHKAVVENEPDSGIRNEDWFFSPRDAIFATYLNIPTNLRRKTMFPKTLSESDYKPTKGKTDQIYYKLPGIGDYEKRGLLKDAHGLRYLAKDENGNYYSRGKRDVEKKSLNFGENKVSRVLSDLGYHTLGRGVDPQKGEYVSYYDLWDIAPFGWNTQNAPDQSRGIGKPLEFYDRLYLDDYYNTDSSVRGYPKGTYYGGWLPEVIIKPKQNDTH